MIRTVVQCDYCGKQHDIQRLGLFSNYNIPAGWLTVASTESKAEHYCSRECVANQVEKLQKQLAEAEAKVAEQEQAQAHTEGSSE